MVRKYRKYKVTKAFSKPVTGYYYPGCEEGFDDYNACKRAAFEAFCTQYLVYSTNGFRGDCHPILECLKDTDYSYERFVKTDNAGLEPDYWCPACNWEGKRTEISWFASILVNV